MFDSESLPLSHLLVIDFCDPEVAEQVIAAVELFTTEEWALVWECEGAYAATKAGEERN